MFGLYFFILFYLAHCKFLLWRLKKINDIYDIQMHTTFWISKNHKKSLLVVMALFVSTTTT